MKEYKILITYGDYKILYVGTLHEFCLYYNCDAQTIRDANTNYTPNRWENDLGVLGGEASRHQTSGKVLKVTTSNQNSIRDIECP